ncbi:MULTISPECIES: AAA family ATPase [unclassified Streptomyces]|uniref:AAA family ATPase n=1 Tax=unclassified Streptomyces TaxID=2593676 RepID=UPI0006F586A6|nr:MULTISPECIES: AAA family ATPase [unclassified Streptomyces]KQX45708.1 TmrB [Streptomyces sp. Root1304]KRA79592.1 TmrB [Streptomyces sp. Root66D1]
MLLWINGPFGGGKTQTAHELHRRLPGSVVCDPEHIGFGLHRTLPPSLRGDFQDLASWRQGVREVLDLALRRYGEGPVIVPMTVTDPGYFAETVGRLRADHGADRVHHVALLAERETVLRRLTERGLGRGLKRESFAVARLDECLERLSGPEFATHIGTDRLTVPQVADRVAELAGLRPLPNTDGPLRHRLRRLRVGLSHIRFDQRLPGERP